MTAKHSLFASLAICAALLTGALFAGRSAAPGAAYVSGEGPNVVVLMTDDQTAGDLAVIAADSGLDRRPRRDIRELVRLVPGLLPVAGYLPERPVRP